jgi:hypothetical protein
MVGGTIADIWSSDEWRLSLIMQLPFWFIVIDPCSGGDYPCRFSHWHHSEVQVQGPQWPGTSRWIPISGGDGFNGCRWCEEFLNVCATRCRRADIRYLNSICAVYLIVFPIVLKETRPSIILTRIAKNMRKETGDVRYRAQIEDERPSLRNLVYISCTRPICTWIISSPSFNLSDVCLSRFNGFRTNYHQHQRAPSIHSPQYLYISLTVYSCGSG